MSGWLDSDVRTKKTLIVTKEMSKCVNRKCYLNGICFQISRYTYKTGNFVWNFSNRIVLTNSCVQQDLEYIWLCVLIDFVWICIRYWFGFDLYCIYTILVSIWKENIYIELKTFWFIIWIELVFIDTTVSWIERGVELKSDSIEFGLDFYCDLIWIYFNFGFNMEWWNTIEL